MSDIEVKKALETVKEVFAEVRKTDDSIISTTQGLGIILLNLRIESAHISTKSNTSSGISPIADELQRNINSINTDVDNLVKNNRKRLNDALNVLDEYFSGGE